MSTRGTTAILVPFKAFVTRILFSHKYVGGLIVNSRIKSERGSIPRRLFDEFFVKWISILALIEDMKCTIEVPKGGDTRCGIQDDPELIQRSQLPTKRTEVHADVFVQNIIIIETIKSHLGDLRPKS